VGDLDGDEWLEWLLSLLAAGGPRWRRAAIGDRTVLLRLQ
jgi:hypothetical protein